MDNLTDEIVGLLRRKGLTLGVVESATGGLISHLITGVSGCSDVYKGSVTSYANDVKIKVVGVSAATLEKYGAVSAPVARQMASGGRQLLGVDICVADTGIAGPTGATTGKPVGLFYIGLATRDDVHTRKHLFKGTRDKNKQAAACAALEWVREWLKANDQTT